MIDMLSFDKSHFCKRNESVKWDWDQKEYLKNEVRITKKYLQILSVFWNFI